jgi:nitroimidazol reductase NimA-like FMN-containing flavoprotein (pyridoxamine 5'-phosphate oxidase superfamily)
MDMVKFSEKEIRFLNYMRVGRLATTDGEAIHVVPICPVFDGTFFYMATHAKTRKG